MTAVATVQHERFDETRRMQREVDQMFAMLGMAEGQAYVASEQPWMPRIDVKRAGRDLVVLAEVPGIEAGEIEVDIAGSVLTIRGERRVDSAHGGEDWLVRESVYGAFERSIELPRGIDPATIATECRHGVLKVTIPRAFEGPVARPAGTIRVMTNPIPEGDFYDMCP